MRHKTVPVPGPGNGGVQAPPPVPQPPPPETPTVTSPCPMSNPLPHPHPQQLSLRWNLYPSGITDQLISLIGTGELVDCTIAVESQLIPAHKLVLAACSPYFRRIFNSNPCKHPIVFVANATYRQVRSLIDFMYNGKADVSPNEVTSILKLANEFQIRGLFEELVENPIPTTSKTVLPGPKTPQASQSSSVQIDQPPPDKITDIRPSPVSTSAEVSQVQQQSTSVQNETLEIIQNMHPNTQSSVSSVLQSPTQVPDPDTRKEQESNSIVQPQPPPSLETSAQNSEIQGVRDVHSVESVAQEALTFDDLNLIQFQKEIPLLFYEQSLSDKEFQNKLAETINKKLTAVGTGSTSACNPSTLSVASDSVRKVEISHKMSDTSEIDEYINDFLSKLGDEGSETGMEDEEIGEEAAIDQEQHYREFEAETDSRVEIPPASFLPPEIIVHPPTPTDFHKTTFTVTVSDQLKPKPNRKRRAETIKQTVGVIDTQVHADTWKAYDSPWKKLGRRSIKPKIPRLESEEPQRHIPIPPKRKIVQKPMVQESTVITTTAIQITGTPASTGEDLPMIHIVESSKSIQAKVEELHSEQTTTDKDKTDEILEPKTPAEIPPVFRSNSVIVPTPRSTQKPPTTGIITPLLSALLKSANKVQQSSSQFTDLTTKPIINDRKSFSTPRKKHVRNLNFSTPQRSNNLPHETPISLKVNSKQTNNKEELTKSKKRLEWTNPTILTTISPNPPAIQASIKEVEEEEEDDDEEEEGEIVSRSPSPPPIEIDLTKSPAAVILPNPDPGPSKEVEKVNMEVEQPPSSTQIPNKSSFLWQPPPTPRLKGSEPNSFYDWQPGSSFYLTPAKDMGLTWPPRTPGRTPEGSRNGSCNSIIETPCHNDNNAHGKENQPTSLETPQPKLIINEKLLMREEVPPREAVPVREPIPTRVVVPLREPIPIREVIPHREPIPTREVLPHREPVPMPEVVQTRKPAPTRKVVPLRETVSTREPIPIPEVGQLRETVSTCEPIPTPEVVQLRETVSTTEPIPNDERTVSSEVKSSTPVYEYYVSGRKKQLKICECPPVFGITAIERDKVNYTANKKNKSITTKGQASLPIIIKMPKMDTAPVPASMNNYSTNSTKPNTTKGRASLPTRAKIATVDTAPAPVPASNLSNITKSSKTNTNKGRPSLPPAPLLTKTPTVNNTIAPGPGPSNLNLNVVNPSPILQVESSSAKTPNVPVQSESKKETERLITKIGEFDLIQFLNKFHNK